MNDSMKREIAVLLLIVAATCYAGVRDELARTKEMSIRSWSDIRDAILTIGPSATNELARAAADENLDWRERFMANVCLERLIDPEIRNAFFANPLKDDPERSPEWKITAAGYAFEEVPLFKKRLSETHFWYSALEVFAMMEDVQMAHPLWKLIDNVIFGSAPAEIRETAARISEAYSVLHYQKTPTAFAGYEYWLWDYVSDGTYPGGAALLIANLNPDRYVEPAKLRAVLDQTGDVDLLESLWDRCTKENYVKRFVNERIVELRNCGFDLAKQEIDLCSDRVEFGNDNGTKNEEPDSSDSDLDDETHLKPCWLIAAFGIGIAAFYAWKILRKPNRGDMRKGPAS